MDRATSYPWGVAQAGFVTGRSWGAVEVNESEILNQFNDKSCQTSIALCHHLLKVYEQQCQKSESSASSNENEEGSDKSAAATTDIMASCSLENKCEESNLVDGQCDGGSGEIAMGSFAANDRTTSTSSFFDLDQISSINEGAAATMARAAAAAANRQPKEEEPAVAAYKSFFQSNTSCKLILEILLQLIVSVAL